MKKRIFTMLSLCLTLTMVLSTLTVSAAGKLSEYDFTAWTQESTSTIDFEDKTVGAEYTAPPAEWSYANVAGDKGTVKEGKYLEMKGFTQLYLKEAITSKYYVFSVDVKLTGKQNLAIFARSGTEKFTMEGNKSDYFEQDRSGGFDSMDSLGGSGFYIRPEGTKIKLYIKLYDESKTCDISNMVYDIDAGVDFSTGLRTITYVDDGSNISIFVEDNLVAKIAFSQSKKYSIGEEDYYSNVVITGADGTQLGTHNNALFAVKSVVAIGDRVGVADLDNIVLKTYKDANPATYDAGLIPGVFAMILASSMIVVFYRKRADV